MIEYECCLCGKLISGFGNNPWPVDKRTDARCCDDCNARIVIPARANYIYTNAVSNIEESEDGNK